MNRTIAYLCRASGIVLLGMLGCIDDYMLVASTDLQGTVIPANVVINAAPNPAPPSPGLLVEARNSGSNSTTFWLTISAQRRAQLSLAAPEKGLVQVQQQGSGFRPDQSQAAAAVQVAYDGPAENRGELQVIVTGSMSMMYPFLVLDYLDQDGKRNARGVFRQSRVLNADLGQPLQDGGQPLQVTSLSQLPARLDPVLP